MNVRNCRVCGKIFNYVMGPAVCPRCKEDSEAKFQEVKQYIQDHRNADIREVSEDSPVQIACEKCGEMIRSGRFCAKCKTDMANGLNNAFRPKKAQPAHPEPKKEDRSKMRFL